ncbi:MAG TPA: TetR/AcrR family transcriptional regulator [Terriglobales bacterium]|nr:TetR/AcrR family transcriptional regulator [Terriglobales bacterium]
MPRRQDPDVERRILQAARHLWRKGGENALSMREVARAAGTNIPAVYRRFRNRNAILRALVESYLEQLFREVEPCTSVPQLLDHVLRFALGRPHEYELMTSGLLARVTQARPAVELINLKAAEWLGGTPEENRKLVMTVWALTHGIILLKISGTMLEKDFPAARAAFHKAVDILIEHRAELDGKKGK